MESFTAAFTVLRLLTPLGMSYAAAKKRAELYPKIVEELPQMRRETVSWCGRPAALAVEPMCWSTIGQRGMPR